ncbi:MAG: T9SS type A sorting domain-containing protein [Bacteroidota bacterium]
MVSQTSFAQVVEKGGLMDVEIDYDHPYDPKHPNAYGKTKTATPDIEQPVLAATPNPATGNIMKIWYNNLVGTSQVRVMDANGRVVYTERVDGTREKEGLLEVSTRNMARGMYFISLTTGAYKMTTKVLVQ